MTIRRRMCCLPLLVVLVANTSCEEVKKVCDLKCGSLATGELTISGNPQIDGFFKALYNLRLAVADIRGRFDEDVLAIGAAFGVTAPAAVDAKYIGDVKAAIDAEYQAKLVGGAPQTVYTPAACHASVDVAVQASAECEVAAGCQVNMECKGGELSFECEGMCEGSCEGTCEVPVCEVQIKEPNFTCAGECQGTCSATVTGNCTGTCRGKCEGTCSAYDENKNCIGQCSGTCQGTCETSVQGSCTGSCQGYCRVSGPQAKVSCQGELRCGGSCQGRCSGSCEGKIKAPHCSLDAECNAAADCSAQASAQASAELQCRPPQLEIKYIFKANVSAAEQAAFFARLQVLEERMASIGDGFARFEVFAKGDAAHGVKPVVETLASGITGLIQAAADGTVEIAPIRLACAQDALQEASQLLVAIPTELANTYTLQLSMMGVVGVQEQQ